MSELTQRIAALSAEQRELLLQRLKDRGAVAQPSAVSQQENEPATPLVPVARNRDLPLSFAQQRLWFLDQLEPGSPLYASPSAYELRGELDVGALQQSLNAVIARHEALRTTFDELAGQPRQLIGPPQRWPLLVLDVQALPGARERVAMELARALVRQPFDLRRGPLVRGLLLRCAPQEHLLVLVLHHIICDEWSLAVLLNDLSAYYQAALRGLPPSLPALAIQYADYALWQREQLRGALLEQQLAYWKAQLAQLPVLDLPTDRPRLNVQSYQGAWQPVDFPSSLTRALKGMSQAEGATLFMLLLAAFQSLLARYSGQYDLVLGTPIAGRSRLELEPLVGLFLNLLVLRTDLGGNPSFRSLLRRVREVALDAFAHQDLPFEKLVEDLQPTRSLSRNPLFQVLFDLHNTAAPALQLPALQALPVAIGSGAVKFDLALIVWETETGLSGSLLYATDLFDPSTITRLAQHFLTLLTALLHAPEQPISSLALLSPAERDELLHLRNRTSCPYPQHTPLHLLIDAQAARSPDAIAAIFADQALSYDCLLARANQLAHTLQARGVGPEVRVALCLSRSLDLLIAVLAVLKSGGAFVPLDPAFPHERLAFILEDAQALLVLTQRALQARLPASPPQLLLDQPDAPWHLAPTSTPSNRSSGANLAYLIYTSGSTGKPKGVLIPHAAIVNYLVWCAEAYGAARGCGAPVHASIAADAIFPGLFAPLLVGRAVLLFGEQQALSELAETLVRGEGFSFIKITPSQLEVLNSQLPAQDARGWVGTLVVGAEAVRAEVLSYWQRHAPTTPLLNEYGPTETVVGCSIYRVPPNRSFSAALPIGQPIANLRFYVLDREMQEVPIGVVGELYIGGAGVGWGYQNRPELTAERFVPDGVSREAGARLYKSGDMVRYLADPEANIAFLGRRDDQVKIRGYRVELGEVEAVLDRSEAVREVVVLAREVAPGLRHLVAYVVPSQEHMTGGFIESLQAHLKKHLPEYMVPSTFVLLERLPLTPHGKIDRNALPAPTSARPDLKETYAAPRTSIEKALASIWSQVLGFDQIGIHDNFFALGGDSIRSIQIIARAKHAGLRLTPRQIFLHQTIAELAAVADTTQAFLVDQGPVLGDVPLTPIQRWFFEQLLPEPDHYNQSILLEVRRPLDPALLTRALGSLLTHHDALRLRFERRDSGWRQTSTEVDAAVPFTYIDLTALPGARHGTAIEAAAADIQASLSITIGPLLRAAWFDLGPRQPGRLLIVIHHLAVDGVSWDILLEDLQMAYAQLSQSKAIALPSKTTSFKHWAERLQVYGQSAALREELAYWLAVPPAAIADLPVDRRSGDNSEASARNVSIILSQQETHALIQEVPAAYRTQINDMLLTALALGYARWSGSRSLLIDLEGHGREDLFDAVDLSRTIGWFTTLFPVWLDLGAAASPGAAIKAIKEQLRRIPHHGIGYGLLRYLNEDTGVAAKLRALPQAEISFNYLGQFEFSGASPLAVAPESTGPNRSRCGRRPYLLEIVGEVRDGRLRTVWTYSAHFHEQATIEALAQHFADALRELIAHCLLPEAGGYTPSDFPLARLDQQQLDRLIGDDRAIVNIYPLTPLQQGLLFHSLYGPTAGVYADQMHYVLRGNLDASAFEHAWKSMAERHPVLRTSFHWAELAEPLQVVHQQVLLPFERYDWRDLDAARRETQIDAYLAADRERDFDLAAAPLMRLALIRTGEDTYHFIWSFHHLLLDGWSLYVLLKELFSCYEAFRAGQVPQLDQSRSYSDYIAWLQRQDMAEAERFWRQTLRGFADTTPLGLDYVTGRAVEQETGYADQTTRLSTDTTAALQALVQRHQLTLNSLFQGVWALLLSHYSAERDVVFGTTVSGRPADLTGIETTVGVFINTLPVRVCVSMDALLLPWLRQLQAHQVEMRQYEYSPLVSIQGWSDVPRGRPLFESILVFENYPEDSALHKPTGSLAIRLVRSVEQSSYPLTVVVAPSSAARIHIIYERRRFTPTAIASTLKHFQTVLESIAAAPDRHLAELPFLTEMERHQLLVAWNPPLAMYRKDGCICDDFELRVERTPEAVAVVCTDLQVTYRALNGRANQLARHLHVLGVGPEARVGLALERSLELVVSLLGLLKAGAAYVPIDPSYPRPYLSDLVKSTDLALLLTQAHLVEGLPSEATDVVRLDSEWQVIAQQPAGNLGGPATAQNLASVILVAGRALLVEQHSMWNHLNRMQCEFELSDTDALLQQAPSASDTAAWEICWPLISGGRLVIAMAGQEDLANVHRTILEQRISIVHFAPSDLSAFVQSSRECVLEPAHSLRCVLCSGEPLRQAVVDAFFQRFSCALRYLYALPEAAGEVSSSICRAGDDRDSVPAGCPAVAVYVLDSRLQPVPVGVCGEIFIAGPRLGRGYLHDPAETALHFTANPFAMTPGERMFRTGDIGRRLEDGILELVGTVEEQIRIKGFCVDLSRVEAALREHPTVSEVVVRRRETETAGVQLVAYLTSDSPFLPEHLHAYLATQLPAPMLPQAYVPLASMPLTPMGQVDEQLLSSLAVLDDQLVRRWETCLRALPEIREAAVLIHEQVESPTPLHLSDAIPGWRTLSTNRGAVEAPLAPAPRARTNVTLGAPSISSGGQLREEPGMPTTLSEALRRASLRSPGEGVIYLQSDGSEIAQSYAALFDEAERIMAGLRRMGLRPQDKVIIQIDLNQDFIPVFWGCVIGGFVPVPISIPPTYEQLNSTVGKLYNAWQMLEQPLIVTTEKLAPSVRAVPSLFQGAPFHVETVDTLRASPPGQEWYRGQPDELALLLLTSGSTGMPKGVMLCHRNILSQAAGTAQMNDFSSQDVSLNWMPLDHVGGIVMFHLRDVFLCCRQIHAPTELVLRNPLIWLDWIDHYRATITWAPNFAYGLINDQAEEIARRQWNLASMRFILNGGEAVVARTARRFMELLGPHGLPSSAMHPAWGMSETSSGVTYSDRFLVESAPEDMAFVEVGAPIPGISLRIVDHHNQVVEEDRIGGLQVRGLTVTGGYYQNPTLNQQVFQDGGWFNTGDLGFLHQGRLSITGREQDIIIIHGVNYYSHEIEAVVEEIEGVEVSYTAACAVRVPGSDTDALAIFFSPSHADERRLAALLQEIRAHVVQNVGVNPTYLIPVAKEVIPKTAIGKIQRSQLKERVTRGEFDDILKRIDILTGNANTLPDWFYRTIWRRKAARTLAPQPAPAHSLIFLDRLGLGQQLCAAMASFQSPCVAVEPGLDFAKLDARRYRINPGDPEHYRRLFEVLAQDDRFIDQVLHLWTYDAYTGPITSQEALEQAQVLGVYSVLFLAQAMERCYDAVGSAWLYVIASHSQRVVASDPIAYERAPVLGLIKTLSQELSWLHCCHIDLPAERVEVNIAHVLGEIRADQADLEVAYRDGERFIPRLEHIDIRQAPLTEPPFKMGGVYLLSGGLGGIGVVIARYLIERYQARLLLVGQTVLPERDTWEAHLSGADAVSRRIDAYRALEQLGGKICYEAVDICDLAQLRRTLERVQTRWQCRLDGVIHLAGTLHERLLIEETRESFEAALRAKVLGTWNLHQLLDDQPGNIFISFSSVNGFFGGTTVGAYAAANSFLDRFGAYQSTASAVRSYCFAWSMWEEVGMSRDYHMQELSRARGYAAISAEQGLYSLLTALCHSQTQLLIGLDSRSRYIRRHLETDRVPLHALTAYITARGNHVPEALLAEMVVTDRFQRRSTCEIRLVEELPLTDAGTLDRERLIAALGGDQRGATGRIAPRNELERQVAGIWQEILRVSNLGINDDFFELGGHSLVAMQLISRLSETFQITLPLRKLFEAPTVAGLAEVIAVAQRAETEPAARALRPIPRDQRLPLSFAQQRLWFLEQLVSDSASYNIPLALCMSGSLNIWALEQSLGMIVSRHEALRTTFVLADGQPVQVITPTLAMPLSLVDLQALPDPDRAAEAQCLATAEAQLPFDLSRGPLIRASLLRSSADEHILLLTVHHIVFDGWSRDLLLQELATLYAAYTTPAVRETSSMPPRVQLPVLPIQYADFAVWQREWLQGPVLAAQLDYWKRRLAGIPMVLDLPTDRPRPPIQSFHGANYALDLPLPLSHALQSLSQREGKTLFMTLLAAFQTLLARYSGQNVISVGVPIAGRTHAALEPLIGFFVNTLIFATDLSGNPRFLELLDRVREVALGAYAHQDLPFEKLVEELQPERDTSRNPVFQVAFALHQAATPRVKLPGLRLRSLEIDRRTAKVDLTLSMGETAEGLWGVLEYNTDLFNVETIARMSGHLQTLLEAIITEPDRRLASLPILTAAECRQMLVDWNTTAAFYPQDRCIHELIAAQALRTPDAVAVLFEQQHLTYQDLDRRSNCLAQHLRTLNVGPEARVGLCVERSLDLVVGILGIFKAGGVYLPLDPSYPTERLQFMLEDADVQVLLTQQPLKARLPAHAARVVYLDSSEEIRWTGSVQPPASGVTPAHLAYIIYTSGSTGRPKGVLVQHGGLCNLSEAQIRAFGLQAHSRVLQFASLSFDASIFEIVMSLRVGAMICLGAYETLLPGPDFISFLRDQGISVVTLPPSVLTMLPSADLPALRIVTVAGEACSADLVARWAPQRQFFNLYGPTEATVWSTMAACTDATRPPTIGQPILNTQIYLLDAMLQPVAIGVPGELYIGGIGLARGYLGRPDLTAERFVPNPFAEVTGDGCWVTEDSAADTQHPTPNTRLYRTGDMARYRPDGSIEFLGRTDQQVKVRGFRIELNEIEAVLGQYAEVRECAVIAHEDTPDDTRLVAYVVTSDKSQVMSSEDSSLVTRHSSLVTELRAFLRAQLPEYMVPAVFVPLDAMPLTPNGKVDRRRLPHFSSIRPQLEPAFIAPRTEVERTIAAIWRKVLRLEHVGVHDNFFDVGGHSLLMIQVYTEIRASFDREISMIEMFRHPTIDALASYFTQDRRQQEAAVPISTSADRVQKKIDEINRRSQLRKGKRTS